MLNLKYWDNNIHSDYEKVKFRILELKKKILDKTITAEEKEELQLLKD